jgi:hypothetical protein
MPKMGGHLAMVAHLRLTDLCSLFLFFHFAFNDVTVLIAGPRPG